MPCNFNYHKQLPFVSVIVPVYNEQRYLDSCLKSIKEIRYPQEFIEIIIVDNGSTDNSVEVARKYTDSVYICDRINVGEMRNFGANKARGEIYAFIDSDCVADQEWINNAVLTLRENDCITGSKVDIPCQSGWIEKAWYAKAKKGKSNETYINSGNLIVPAEIFKKLNGFNPSLVSGEDAEFCYRARKLTKIISDPKIKVTHYGNPKTIRQFIRREIWHGLGAFGTFRIYHIDKPFFGTILFALFTLIEIAGLFMILIKNDNYPLIVGLLGNVWLITYAACYRCYRNKRFGINTLFQLMLLYQLYFLGRSVSLYYLVTDRKYMRKQR